MEIADYYTKNIYLWTKEDVLNWLGDEIGFDRINKELFIHHEIDGNDLIDLTEDNLKYDLKIMKLHDRKFILRCICDLLRNIVDQHEIISKKQKIQPERVNSFKILPNEKVQFQSQACMKTEEQMSPVMKKFNLQLKKNNLISSQYYNSNVSKIPQDVKNQNSTLHLFSKNNTMQEESGTLILRENSLAETAMKNRYLSFDNLDNFEKNGFSFSVKRNLNKLQQKGENDNVTINSFYNISNLNNFNNAESNSNINLQSNEHSVKKNHTKSGKKKASCVNIRSKTKIDFEKLSDNEMTDEEIYAGECYTDRLPKQNYRGLMSYVNKMENKHQEANSTFNPQNLNLNSNISADSENPYYRKNNFFDKLYNYYNDAQKIKCIYKMK
jgi:hypothetical protein